MAPLFIGGAGFGGWLGILARPSPVSGLVISKVGAWRVRSHMGGAEVDGPKGLNFFLG